MSILFALLAACGWGSSDFAAGYASRRSSAMSVVVLTYLTSSAAFLVVSRLPGQEGAMTGGDLVWSVAAGVAGGVAAMFLFRGLARGAMAVVAPVTATGAASIPALYGIVTGEPITVLGILGIVVGLAAIVFVSLAPSDASDAAESADAVASIAPIASASSPGASPLGSTSPPPPPPPPHPLLHGHRTVAAVPPGGTPAAAAPPASAPPPPAAVAPPVSAPPAPAPAPGSIVGPTDPVALRPNEIRMSLTRIRTTITMLVVALVLSLTLAIRPTVVAAIDGEPLTSGTVGTLLLAATAAVLALVAVREARALFGAIGGVGAPDPGAGGAARPGLIRQPGLGDALVASVSFGLFFVFISRTSADSGHWPMLTARGVSALLFVAAAVIVHTPVLPHRSERRWVVVAGILDAFAAACFVIASRSGYLSVVAVLASMYPVATILLARAVVKERVRREQMVGLALAGMAVGLLAVSSG